MRAALANALHALRTDHFATNFCEAEKTRGLECFFENGHHPHLFRFGCYSNLFLENYRRTFGLSHLEALADIYMKVVFQFIVWVRE